MYGQCNVETYFYKNFGNFPANTWKRCIFPFTLIDSLPGYGNETGICCTGKSLGKPEGIQSEVIAMTLFSALKSHSMITCCTHMPQKEPKELCTTRALRLFNQKIV